MDLSKAFGCITHDLLIVKLSAYGFDRKSLISFYSCLKRRKQCFNFNNIQNTFKTILSGVPQGSTLEGNNALNKIQSTFKTLFSGVPQGTILGPLLFNIFINGLIGFIKKSLVYNFADDNTIAAFEKDITLLKALQNEVEIAVQWFKDNFMIVNPGKFQAMVMNRCGKLENKHKKYIDNKKLTSEQAVKLLVIEIDNQLNFDNDVSKICKEAGYQLNAIGRLRKYIGFPGKKTLIGAFAFSSFNYCPLVWHFPSMTSKNKIEFMQKRALRLLHNDYTSTCDGLFAKSNKPSIELKRYRTLALQILKTVSFLNPKYMQNLFYLRSSPARRLNNIAVVRRNTYMERKGLDHWDRGSGILYQNT